MHPHVRKSWSPKGKTPVITQRTRHYQKASAVGVIVTTPALRKSDFLFRLHSGKNISISEIKNFLQQLRRSVRGPIILLWDRLQAHRNKSVIELAGRLRIDIEFFPPYAPELNPQEYIWNWLKMNPLANAPRHDLTSLCKLARCSLRQIKSRHCLIAGCIRQALSFFAQHKA